MRGENVAFSDVQNPISDESQVRASYYLLLSRLLYSPPTRETLDGVASFKVPANKATSEFLIALNNLADAAANATNLEALDDEYHDLFIGLGRGEVVLYGSWYITGMMMDKPLSLLREDLKALGIERSKDLKEPEDHIAGLLDVMGIIIMSGTEMDFKVQQTMFKKHLKPWGRRFFKDLEVARKAEFYSKVGTFGVKFIDFETEYLSMLT